VLICCQMPLDLNDKRWSTLKTAYQTPASEVAESLAIAYRSGISEELLGNIINEVQHQGDTSEAMYAVAPHLLELSKMHDGDLGLQLLLHTGLICGSSQLEGAVACPIDLIAEFEGLAEQGRRLTLKFLEDVHDFEDFKYLLAALAGFSNQGRFGKVIEGFDLFENKFFHVLLDEPLDDA